MKKYIAKIVIEAESKIEAADKLVDIIYYRKKAVNLEEIEIVKAK